MGSAHPSGTKLTKPLNDRCDYENRSLKRTVFYMSYLSQGSLRFPEMRFVIVAKALDGALIGAV